MLKKIASNVISQVFSKIVTAIISIFLISSLTKYLSPELYGQYNKIYNYVAIFTFLADLGLYTISVREISKDKENSQKIVGNIMTLRLILGIFIIFLSIFIALFLPGYNTKVSLISIFIVGIFSVFNLMNSSVLSLMQANLKMEFSGFSFVLGKILNLLLILSIIFLLFPKVENNYFFNKINFSYQDLAFIFIMISGLISTIFNFYLNYFHATKIVKFKFLFDFDYIKYLFKLSLPNGIALFLSMVYLKIDVFLISLIENTQKADISIAFYSLPVKIIEVLMVISIFFLNSILPSLSQNFRDNNTKKLKNILENSFKFLFSFGFLVVLFGIIFGKNIISIIATPDYLDETLYKYTSYDAMVISVMVLLFNFISSLFNYIFISSKNEKKLVIINLTVTIINIIGNIVLIPYFSFVGSSIVTLISQLVLFGMGYYFSRNIIKFDIELGFITKIISFSILLFIFFSYLVKNYSLGNYLNIFIYGTFLFILFSCFSLFLNRKILFKKD